MTPAELLPAELQAVSEELKEAARLDGATGWLVVDPVASPERTTSTPAATTPETLPVILWSAAAEKFIPWTSAPMTVNARFAGVNL